MVLLLSHAASRCTARALTDCSSLSTSASPSSCWTYSLRVPSFRACGHTATRDGRTSASAIAVGGSACDLRRSHRQGTSHGHGTPKHKVAGLPTASQPERASCIGCNVRLLAGKPGQPASNTTQPTGIVTDGQCCVVLWRQVPPDAQGYYFKGAGRVTSVVNISQMPVPFLQSLQHPPTAPATPRGSSAAVPLAAAAGAAAAAASWPPPPPLPPAPPSAA